MDPAVFKDSDGKYYMYFGGLWGGQLQHWKTGKHTPQDDSQPADDKPALYPKVARMADNMVEFAEKPKDLKIVDENGKTILSGDHVRRFFEASWMHKYKDNYYFSYSTGDTHTISYAMGKSPYGPFTYKGVILQPVLGWTNHHSIAEVGGKWYIFYHDSQKSNGVNHLRNVKEPIELTYNEDGTIQPIDAYKGDDAPAAAAEAAPADRLRPPRELMQDAPQRHSLRTRPLAARAASICSLPKGLIIRPSMSVTLETPTGSPSLFRRRSAFLAPLWLLALGGVIVVAAAFTYWNAATTTTIVVIRHAEKAGRRHFGCAAVAAGRAARRAPRADVR